MDGKDVGGIGVAHRRLSFDCKTRPVFSHHSTSGVCQTRSSEDMEKVKSKRQVCPCQPLKYLPLDLILTITVLMLTCDFSQAASLMNKVDGVSDENLADSIHHEHFAGRTAD